MEVCVCVFNANHPLYKTVLPSSCLPSLLPSLLMSWDVLLLYTNMFWMLLEDGGQCTLTFSVHSAPFDIGATVVFNHGLAQHDTFTVLFQISPEMGGCW